MRWTSRYSSADSLPRAICWRTSGAKISAPPPVSESSPASFNSVSVSVTDFFAGKTREPLGSKFLPIVTTATEKVSLVPKYNAVAKKASGFGLVSADNANLQQYVTGKALDGLYKVIGEEEKKIRQDPVGTGSAILKQVFGALK